MSESISVVIPLFQGERFIAEALESVVAQEGVTVGEILVVDDGSSDHGPTIAERFGAKVMRNPRKGVAAARNYGIEQGNGDVIALLDQDDVWLPGKLAAQSEALRRQPEALCYTHQRFFLEPGEQLPRWFGKPELLDQDHPGFVPSCLAFRRQTWLELGPFDETLRQASDSDWYARARSAAIPIVVIGRTLVVRRIHEGADSGSASAIPELVLTMRAAAARARAAREKS